jgi:hypothetical protein
MVLSAMIAAVLGLCPATQAQVLVDYDDGQDNGLHDKEVRSGGFTGMNDFKYGPWVLLSKVGGMRILSTMPCDVGSAENVVVCDVRVMAMDTGHTIAAGDKFNLGFHWRDAAGWGNEDVVTLMLYYTENDKVDGTTVGTVALNTGARKQAGTWEMVHSKAAAFPDDKGVGKKLFVRLLTRSNPNEYARVDNVFVEVVPAAPKEPAEATAPAEADEAKKPEENPGN